MEIIVGKTAGFCGGVINSIKKTENLLSERDELYCLGELVHNKQVVDKLKEKGLIVVDRLSEVPNGADVVIRAHGIPKEIYELVGFRDIKLIDLTCPKVLKIHEEASRLVEEDYFIILTAQKDHPEAIGTISFCGDDSVILEDESQIDEVVSKIFVSNKKKVAVISQTTYSVSKFERCVEMLKSKLRDFEMLINNTICGATHQRQEETRELASKVDAMIIIGGKNSSNTKKLYEVASKECNNTYLIETLSDLEISFDNVNVIGVMAGASTPKESIDEVVLYLSGVDK